MTKKTKPGAPQAEPDLYKNLLQTDSRAFSLPITERSAFKILGPERCFTADRVAEVFNPYRQFLKPLDSPSQLLVPYTGKTLRHRAVGGGWLLMYSYGLSLRELYLMFGDENSDDQPKFCPCCDKSWWLQDKRGWADQRGQPGYYLLDLQSRFRGFPYDEQNLKIWRDSGLAYERAPINLLAEAYFAACLLNDEERFDDFHWGNVCYGGNNKELRLSVANSKGKKHAPRSFLVIARASDQGKPGFGAYVIRRPEVKNIILA